MFIDTHCHLYKEYYEDLDVIINDCIKNNVNRVIVSGCDMKSNLEVLELISKYDIVYGTIGFHPTELDDFNDDCFSFLEKNIDNKKIVGIGEIGLDYHYEDTNKEKQKRVFRRQLEIAEKHNKPVIIHSRDSIGETYNILKEYKLRGTIHCFSGSLEMAKEFIKLGYMIGVGGIISFKNAKTIKEVVKNIDTSYILLETDSPYLSPEPFRGERNSPRNIPIIAKCIAEEKNIPIAEIARATTQNAEGLFDFFNN